MTFGTKNSYRTYKMKNKLDVSKVVGLRSPPCLGNGECVCCIWVFRGKLPIPAIGIGISNKKKGMFRRDPKTGPNMGTARILVVDEPAHFKTVIDGTLAKDEYSTVVAGGLLEAIGHMERDPRFDLILADLVVSGRNGKGLLERLCRLQPDIPLVVMSRDAKAGVVAVRQGAYDYLLKPFEKEQLITAVKRVVDYRRLLQQSVMYRQDLEQMVNARTGMLHQAIADLERSYDITLEALGDALDLKDAETEGHSKRVTAFTIALARGAGIAPQQIPVIARGAFLHDIGKMAIPDAILLKPSKLQADEQKIMREHCARGYQMLRKIPFLQEAAEIVYSHQEHYDGSGYPRGLKGDEIPLGARIFAVADTLDAITSDRPYRKGNSFSAARAEIKRCAGTQFDPRVVEVYLSLPDQLWEDLRAEISHPVKKASTLQLEQPQDRSKSRDPLT